MEYINKIKEIIDKYLKLKELKKYNYFENINKEHIKIKVEIELNNEKGNTSDNELIKELDYKFEYCGFENNSISNKIIYSYKLDKEKLNLSEEQFNSKIKLLFQKVEAYIKLNKRPQFPEEIPTDKKILEEKIVYWSEGNKYLEELLRISLENGYITHACCGGHEDKKNFAYISYNLNIKEEKNYIFVNKVFKIIENKEDYMSMYFEKEEFINVVFHAKYGLQDELFKNIIKIINEIKNLNDEEIKKYIFSDENSIMLKEAKRLENIELNIPKNLTLISKKDNNNEFRNIISISHSDKENEIQLKEKLEELGYNLEEVFEQEGYYYSSFNKQV